MERITRTFFEMDPLTCSRGLIGAVLVWKGCEGRIVETEAYDTVGDPASHTWTRPSSRVFVETHAAGDAYVYLNYGAHWLFNILVKGPERSGFVLFRAIEPVAGLELMRARRGAMKDSQLGAGPGKLTRALGIDGSSHGVDFLDSADCALFRGPAVTVITGPRIGISRAADRPWRFGDPSSPSLSRRF
ncbi:MAG: DNA-3-methyladenine glycosylase [Luteolibacter sp.]